MTAVIEAFIFDLDGVLTDTAALHYQAWKRLAAEEGIPFTREDNEKLRGVSRRRSLELLLKGRYFPEEKIQEMMERKNRYYLELVDTITEEHLLPGVKELLTELKNINIRTAVASSSKNAQIVLENLGIAELFAVVCDGYSVKKAKPAPDLFLSAAKALGVKACSCLVVEDAEAGVEAALNAHMMVVGIGPPERVGKAHFHYNSVAEIKLNQIIPHLVPEVLPKKSEPYINPRSQ